MIFEPVVHRLETETERGHRVLDILVAAERYYAFVLDGHEVGMASPVPPRLARDRLAWLAGRVAAVRQRQSVLERRLRLLRSVYPVPPRKSDTGAARRPLRAGPRPPSGHPVGRLPVGPRPPAGAGPARRA